MVAFETESVWEHSFYGYLFFKELTPLGAHGRDPVPPPALRSVHRPRSVRKILAGAVHVADRVDVLLLERPQADVVEVERLLAASRPGAAPARGGRPVFEARSGVSTCSRSSEERGVKQPDRSHIVDDPDGTGSAFCSSTCSCMSSIFAAGIPSPIR